MPNTVQQACLFAQVQEGVLARAKSQPSKFQRYDNPSQRSSSGARYENGDLWKAKQLKDYRRTNNLCYRCGEKYVPGHQCAGQAPIQVRAIQEVQILSNELLDAISRGEDTIEESQMHVSLNALAGTVASNCLQLRALVDNKVMLILIDFGSSHSFIDSALVQ